MSLISKLQQFVPKLPSINLRPRKEFYATEALTDSRDLFWKIKGEPETDKTDFTGLLRMLCGDAIEKGIRDQWLARLHLFGVHLIDSQLKFGDETWHGYGDFYLGIKETPTSTMDKYVIEFKTKWGIGADLLWKDPKPSPEYLAQLGFYLKDFCEKKQPIQGILFYLLLSDNNFGETVEFNCEYNPENKEVRAVEFIKSNGYRGPCDIKVSLSDIEKRWAKVKKHISVDEIPNPDYIYKYPLTTDLLSAQSDYTLRRMLSGNLVLGDWQIKYSRYKKKHLQMTSQTDGYSPEEMKLILAEYKRRHPKSKL